MKNIIGLLILFVGAAMASLSIVPLVLSLFGLAKIDSFFGSTPYIIFSIVSLVCWYGGLRLLKKGGAGKGQLVIITILFMVITLIPTVLESRLF